MLMGRVMSAETDIWAEVRHVMRQGPRRTRDIWRANKQDSTDWERSVRLGWARFAYRASCAMLSGLALSLVFAS